MCPAVAENPDVDLRLRCRHALVLAQVALDGAQDILALFRVLQDALHNFRVAADVVHVLPGSWVLS